MKRGYGVRADKRLGQHFLRDPGMIHAIIERAGLKADDRVLEVGPGLGALTIPLGKAVREIIAVEKDARLADELSKRLARAGLENVHLYHEDILRFDFDRLRSDTGGKIVVLGNLPYNISSPFLGRLIRHRRMVRRAVLMFQLELGNRLTASPGSRAYGSLTIIVRYYSSPTPLLKVPKEAFYPRPKVNAMVLELDFEAPHGNRAENEGHFFRIVKGAFSQRRKMLVNALRGAIPGYDRETIFKAMAVCGIAADKRAESLTIDDFLCLSAALDSLS